MSTNRRRCQGGLCLISLMALAGCFAKPMKLKTADAASEARQSDGGGAGGEAAPGDGPGPVVDSNMTTDGFSSSGGSNGSGGIGGKGGASTLDANANGGNGTGGISSNGSTGGGMAGSGGTGFDAASDLSPDGPAIDAPGTCSADRDCTSQAPLCLGNRCAKCAGDSDCAGRAGPACAASGLCVACTANKHCTGTAATCDLTTNQCVGCVTRSDCAGACQSCTSGGCVAVKSKDDPGFCAGTCDASGACRKKQGQACQTPADCAGGIACADGYCCDKACKGSCEACDVPSSLGTCTTLAANATPRADRTACAGSSPCKGSCNGTSASCTYPGVETTCVQPSCTGQTATLAASCAGDGTCTPATTKPCNGYGCSTTSPVCQTSCPVSGQILCNGSCVDVMTSPSHCGSCTNVCTPPATGTVACVGGTCIPTCNDGQPACGGIACCPAPPPNSTACNSGVCTPKFTHPISCGGVQRAGSWNFESDDFEGWSRSLFDPTLTYTVSPLPKPSGTSQWALAGTIDNYRTDGDLFEVSNTPCAGTSINLANKNLSLKFYVAGASLPTDGSSHYVSVGGVLSSTTKFLEAGNVAITPTMYNIWVSQKFTFGSAFTDVTALIIDVFMMDSGPPDPEWKGTVYIDDIAFDP